MTLFVSNILYNATEDEVRELFEPFGQVIHVHMALDRVTKQFRGYCFVELDNDEDGNRAILELNKTKFLGRTVFVRQSDKDRR